MKLLQLKNPNANQFGPGGWPFLDPRTGFKCNGWEGTPQMHAVKIAAHRRANPKFYPPGEGQWFDMNSIVQEIYAQKVQTHPHLFKGYSDDAPHFNAQPTPKTMVAPGTICPKCSGSSFSPVYCPTCSGRRIKSWKCEGCGHQI